VLYTKHHFAFHWLQVHYGVIGVGAFVNLPLDVSGNLLRAMIGGAKRHLPKASIEAGSGMSQGGTFCFFVAIVA